MLGYHGQYLRIDLTQEKAEWRELAPGVLRRFLGGVGLGTWLLHHESPRGADALDAVAPLIFAFSPLVGTSLTTSAKFAVLAKSPLTHRINDALDLHAFDGGIAHGASGPRDIGVGVEAGESEAFGSGTHRTPPRGYDRTSRWKTV